VHVATVAAVVEAAPNEQFAGNGIHDPPIVPDIPVNIPAYVTDVDVVSVIAKTYPAIHCLHNGAAAVEDQ